MLLRIHHPDAREDPYPIRDLPELEDAIAQEAGYVASEAGSDLLESPDQEHRDQLRDAVIYNARRALRGAGDSYTDPTGVRWTLENPQED